MYQCQSCNNRLLDGEQELCAMCREDEYVEVEEHYKDGVLVKRLVNGVEVETGPPIQSINVFVKKEMIGYGDAFERFGHLDNFPIVEQGYDGPTTII